MAKKGITKASLIAYRSYNANTDENIILSTWRSGLYFSQPFFSQMRKDEFFSAYEKIIKYLLSKPSAAIIIACLVADPDCILGYCVMERAHNKTYLHWIYVKTPWRKIGIAKGMLPDHIDAVTHLNPVGAAIMPKEISFNPFLIT